MLILFHGTDTFRIRQAVDGQCRSFNDGSACRPVRIDCTDADAADELERQLKYPSFFGDRKLVIATNAAHRTMGDILDRFDPATLDDIILIAVQDTGVKGADAKILKRLLGSADRHEEFLPLKGAALSAWVTQFCADRQTAIEPAAVREITRRAADDTGRLAGELEKLCAYAAGAPVTEPMVRLLTAERPERDEWELSNALAGHDKRAMVAALWRRVQEGTPEQLLLGSVASGLRNLLIIKQLSAQRLAPAAIAKRAGIHAFVVSKTLARAAASDERRLRGASVALSRLDRDAKDGRADTVDGMFSVILSL